MQIFDVEKCRAIIVLAVLRIRDVYTGSGIRIFPCQIPDSGFKRSRIRIKDYQYLFLPQKSTGSPIRIRNT